MNELQKKLLALKAMRDATSAIFAKYEDVATMTPEDLASVKANNTQIETLDAECKNLEELEALKAKNADGIASFKHQVADTKPATAGTVDDSQKRAAEVARVKFMPRVASVKNFKGDDKEFKAYQFAHWFVGHVLHEKSANGFTQKSLDYCKAWGLETKAQSETVNTAGGYLVPTEFGNDIIDLREEYGVLRRLIKVSPMMSDTKSIPRRTGGLTVYYPAEGGTITQSEKAWDNVMLTAKKYATLALYSSELNEDSMISMGDDLASEIAYAFALAEDTNGFNGDGTSTYCRTVGLRQRLLDVFTATGGTGLVLAAGNNYSEITLRNFHSVIAALPLYARGRAKWVCSATFHDTVMQPLQTAAGGNDASNIAAGGTPRFLGYPVELSQVYPTTEANSQIPVTLGDYEMAGILGDRRQLTIKYSDEYKFAEDQLAIRGTQRIDINWHSVGSTGVAGPVVGLIMAAS
jgi:HK97 family phage major capsid protein